MGKKGARSEHAESEGSKKSTVKTAGVIKTKPRNWISDEGGLSCKLCGKLPTDPWPLVHPTPEEAMWGGCMVWLRGSPGKTTGRYDKLCFSVFGVGGYMQQYSSLGQYPDRLRFIQCCKLFALSLHVAARYNSLSRKQNNTAHRHKNSFGAESRGPFAIWGL